MSSIEKISKELISIAYMDKMDRVKSIDKLEKDFQGFSLDIPNTESELIREIIVALKADAKKDELFLFDDSAKYTVDNNNLETEIEVVEPIIIPNDLVNKQKSRRSKIAKEKTVVEESDFSFLDTIEDAF